MALHKQPTLVTVLLVLIAVQYLNLLYGIYANRTNKVVYHRVFQVIMLFDILFSISLSFLSFLMLIPACLRFILFVYDFVLTSHFFEAIVKDTFSSHLQTLMVSKKKQLDERPKLSIFTASYNGDEESGPLLPLEDHPKNLSL